MLSSQTKLRFHFLVFISLWLLLATTNTVAKPVYTPTLSAIDEQHQTVYLLESREYSFNQITFRQYRLWSKNRLNNELVLLNWLGTKVLPQAQHIVGMGWDSDKQRLVFADAHSKSIFSFDVRERRRGLISGASKKGTGPRFENLGALIVDPIAKRIIVVDHIDNAEDATQVLIQVDQDTGDRSVFYRAANKHLGPFSLALDKNTYQLFMSYGYGVASIDMYTGESYTVTDSTQHIGHGASIVRMEDIAFDYHRHQLLATEPLLKRLIGIDIATGLRSIVYEHDADTEQYSLCWPTTISIHGKDTVIADQGMRNWMHFDLDNRALEGFTKQPNHKAKTCSQVATKQYARLLTAGSDTLKATMFSIPDTGSADTSHDQNPILVFLGLLMALGTLFSYYMGALAMVIQIPFLLLLSPLLLPLVGMIYALGNKTIFNQESVRPIIAALSAVAGGLVTFVFSAAVFVATWFAPIVLIITLITFPFFTLDQIFKLPNLGYN